MKSKGLAYWNNAAPKIGELTRRHEARLRELAATPLPPPLVLHTPAELLARLWPPVNGR